MRTQTKYTQEHLTPTDAHRILAEGNARFVQNVKAQRNLQDQVLETSKGQYPFAVVLSCIDSRVPAELVFDQGIGDIFSVRVAGNIVNVDVLGSMEFACNIAGSKIVVVLGHSKCGAVTAACNGVELGNITAMLSKIKPAVESIQNSGVPMDACAIEQVATLNVELSIQRIRKESLILSEMESRDEIEIVGALYDVTNGRVEFM
jgi:carbonic anhydrase